MADASPDELCLCWGTCEGAQFVELVAAASAASYRSVAVTPAMVQAELGAGRTPSELRRILDDHGVRVAMLDPLIRGLPNAPEPDEVGPRFRPTFQHGEQDCYALAEAVGAAAINVAHYLGRPTALEVLADAIGAIAGRAGERGLEVYVEFMPEGSIGDLTAAATIVAKIARPNVGVMLDTWHFYRTGGTVDQLRKLPTGAVHAIQVSDAPPELFGTGLTPPSPDRRLPGDGAIALRDIVEVCRARHRALVIALEVFDRAGRDTPAAERAQRAAAAYRALWSE